jgi:hypothetical protein
VVVHIFMTAVGAVALSATLSSGCGSHLVVTKGALQKDISDRLAKAGQPPQSVTCKEDLIGEVGRTARCDVVVSPTDSFEPIVRVTGVDGTTVNYDMKPSLSQEQLQQSVSRLIAQASGVPVKSVACESGLDGTSGTDAYCWVDAGGVRLRRTVEVKSVNGLMMNYDLTPVLTRAEIEKSLLDQLEQQSGQRPDGAACTDNLEGKTGTTIDCLVVSGGAGTTYAVTVTAVEGTKINYSYAPKT